MKTKWFGDQRDYVKWSYIHQHARDNTQVLYVPMLTDTPDLYPSIPPQIRDFFSRKKHLAQFGELFPGRFQMIEGQYSAATAAEYFDLVHHNIRQLKTSGPIVIFLDPDTGIQPLTRFDSKHVRLEDMRKIWHPLSHGDALIVYQHAYRKIGWRQQVTSRLKEERAFADADIQSFCNADVAKDVCFFALTKRGEQLA